MSTCLLRAAPLLVLAGVAACADTTPAAPAVRPSPAAAPLTVSRSSTSSEKSSVSPALARLNRQLAATGSKTRVLKAELLMDGTQWNGATSTIVFADDRSRGIGAEWVKRDPRRGGRGGVSYAVASGLTSFGRLLPLTRDPNGANVRPVPPGEVEAQIEEAMAAWRARTCSRAPITRVPVAETANPDLVDDFLFDPFIPGPPFQNYAQPGDIVQSGWMHPQFFRLLVVALADPNEEPPDPATGDFILGVTLTFVFVDDKGTPTSEDDTPTDIDRNGKADIQLAEIYYNARYAWGNNRALNVVDFYSVIAHEAGHALGLSHFGKIFVTKKDFEDDGGLSLSEIKYAPYALMNASYITGRNEIAGTDESQFCQIWSSK